jgi:oligopeptide transport system substrate-binding protein
MIMTFRSSSKSFALTSVLLLLIAVGCGKRETRVEIGNREGVLHKGNKTEPQDLDPHIVEGTGEHQIISCLLEGLTAEDPVTLAPVPGAAERWEISEDGKVYTFFIRPNALWSNGDKLTAHDFYNSYRRILTPSLGSRYASMLYPIVNAQEFNGAKITDFGQVGVKALDDTRLEITLNNATPYFLEMTAQHYTYWPVHLPTIEKHGDPYLRGNKWTLPENYVGNGPFVLTEWRVGDVIKVRKSDTYWDKANPTESVEAEERAFRSGQLHLTEEVPSSKVKVYLRDNPTEIRIDDFLATYLYRINTTREHTKDPRVRHALSMAVNRDAIVQKVTMGGQKPAYALTPPNTRGYTSRAQTEYNPEKARTLLAEAGYPGGMGFPKISILFNTSENHKVIAEAIQQMWNAELGINVELVNQEWKVYLDNEHDLNYDVSRAGWVGDYPDPFTFLSTFASWNENNRTGWVNKNYDALLDESMRTVDPAKRIEVLKDAEAILLEDMPMIPIYFYTRVYLIAPSVKNWNATFADHHPYKYVYLDAGAK